MIKSILTIAIAILITDLFKYLIRTEKMNFNWIRRQIEEEVSAPGPEFRVMFEGDVHKFHQYIFTITIRIFGNYRLLFKLQFPKRYDHSLHYDSRGGVERFNKNEKK